MAGDMAYGALRRIREAAKGQVGCTCKECIAACNHVPGWFLPDEIAPVAEFLGLTVEELFATKLQVDYWTDKIPNGVDEDGEPAYEYPAYEYNDIWVICPNQLEHDPGTKAGWWRTGYACVFLTEDDRCEIHPVKPFECRVVACKGPPDGASLRPRIAEAWKSTEGRKLVERLWK